MSRSVLPYVHARSLAGPPAWKFAEGVVRYDLLHDGAQDDFRAPSNPWIAMAFEHGIVPGQAIVNDDGSIDRAWDSEGRLVSEQRFVRLCRDALKQFAVGYPSSSAARDLARLAASRRPSRLQPRVRVLPRTPRAQVRAPSSVRRAVRTVRTKPPDPEPPASAPPPHDRCCSAQGRSA